MRKDEEIIEDLHKAYKTLDPSIDKLQSEYLCAITESIPLDRLEQICNAEREGRCVVLPCMVGGHIYTRKRKKLKVIYIAVAEDGGIDVRAVEDTANSIWTGTDFEDSDFGKTVFLTREAAEAALEAQK